MSAVVRVRNARGSFVRCRALLDTCATAHFMTEDLARNLGATIRPCSLAVGAINDLNTISNGTVELSIHLIHNKFKKTLSFLLIPKIAERVPNTLFPRESIDVPRNLKLADPQFHMPRSVDMVIEAALSLLPIGQINLSRNNHDLFLQKTQLGWVVVEGVAAASKRESVTCNLAELTEQIAKFWALEDTTANRLIISENEECENHFTRNTTRNNSGRYVVRLPFRPVEKDFGNSRAIAFRHFHGLQKKLGADPKLKKEYERVMNEYIELGHLSLLIDESEGGCFLPHHAIIKSTSATTKVRVVFDASAKTQKEVSLNDTLMVGPTIQGKLFEHLLRFRTHKYVLTADIEKMYRQILIYPDDRQYQKIFWYHEDRIRVFQLNTVTFGVSSAPYLAIRTIQQLTKDEGADFPSGAESLKRDLYVDDLLTGADTLEKLIQIRDEVIEILGRGGFSIRQWASTYPQALKDLNERILDVEFLTNENPILKILGVVWNARRDELIYTVKPIKSIQKISKRHILSEITKIFDPLGLLGPVILACKALMQECWKAKVLWDESVPSALHSSWLSFSDQLQLIDHLNIDRRLIIDKATEIQIHGFCDASKIGYGACIYIQSRNRQGDIQVRLCCSKVRVALLKDITMPRLELCSALTLARLYREVCAAFTFRPDTIVFWSDSMIVLHWLKKAPNSLKVFEANRVKEIQEISGGVEWRHVRSENNPADALSQSQLPREFLKNESWSSRSIMA